MRFVVNALHVLHAHARPPPHAFVSLEIAVLYALHVCMRCMRPLHAHARPPARVCFPLRPCLLSGEEAAVPCPTLFCRARPPFDVRKAAGWTRESNWACRAGRRPVKKQCAVSVPARTLYLMPVLRGYRIVSALCGEHVGLLEICKARISDC